jgi:hypothetical protein
MRFAAKGSDLPHRRRSKALAVIAASAVVVLASAAVGLAQTDLLAQGDSASTQDPGLPTSFAEAQARFDPEDDPTILLEELPDGTWTWSYAELTSPEAAQAFIEFEIRTDEQWINRMDEVVRRVQELQAKQPGELLVSPSLASPGDTVELTIVNRGDQVLQVGLFEDNIEVYRDGRWEAANEAVYGRPEPGVRPLLLNIPPGETLGPDYDNGITDRVPLPNDLSPGYYRVSKPARYEGGDEFSLRIRGVFEVEG